MIGPTLWIRRLLALTVCAVAPSLAAQPGIMLGDPSLAIARDSYPPLAWRSRDLEQPISIVVPWFGSAGELAPDAWRTLLCVMDDQVGPGRPIIRLRYNPALSAVEFQGEYRPEIRGREPVPGSYSERDLGSIRVTGVPLGEDRNHCALLTFDPGQRRFALHVASEGSAEIRSEFGLFAAEAVPAIRPQGRIFLGSPLPNAVSHTGPIFPVTIRRGVISGAAFEGIWNRPGGPRLTDLTGPGEAIGEDIIALLLGGGSDDYVGLAQTGRARWWYDGDIESWFGFASERNAVAYRNGSLSPELSSVAPAPVFEPGQPWSGLWRPAPPTGGFVLGLPDVQGNLPRLNAVLRGTRTADAALTAWGLGNSRWSNTTPVPAGLADPTLISRSHLLGLRAARPQRDGGLVVLNVSATDSIDGIDLVDTGGAQSDLFTNWTRFSYGSSFAGSPGTGTPMHIDPERALTFVADQPGDAPTQSIAIVLERPRGGRLTAAMYITDADGTGRVVEAQPLPGSGSVVDTDTTTIALPVIGVTDTTCKVQGDTSAISPGDLLVGEDDAVVNVVEAVSGETITLRFPWTDAPTPGETVAFGPFGYRVVGFTSDQASANAPRRGLRLETSGQGRVTLCGIGIRSLDPNRICYVLAGRGGLGQSQQAEREAPGVLAAMADALGVELFFTGLATQSDGGVAALQAQLGQRIETHEFIGTPDVINAQGNALGSQSAVESHNEMISGARANDGWAYLQIQDEFPATLDQELALFRHDAPHPNGRAMLAAGELWWSRLEAARTTLLTNGGCVADVNRDGTLSPSDFNAWLLAFNNDDLDADQNGDAVVSPSDFNGWILNFTAGCP